MAELIKLDMANYIEFSSVYVPEGASKPVRIANCDNPSKLDHNELRKHPNFAKLESVFASLKK